MYIHLPSSTAGWNASHGDIQQPMQISGAIRKWNGFYGVSAKALGLEKGQGVTQGRATRDS